MPINKTCYYFNSRPSITISGVKGSTIRRNSTYERGQFIITSTYRLSVNQIVKLWEAGLLGSGQSFRIESLCDGKEDPAGEDIVNGTMVDENGKILDEPPTLWNGAPAKPASLPYYEYRTSYICDSSD